MLSQEVGPGALGWGEGLSRPRASPGPVPSRETTMRVWLVEDKTGEDAGCVEALLRQLEKRPATGLQLVGAAPFQSDFVAAMRKLVPDLLDVIVISERAWPEGSWTQEVLGLGPALV